MEPILSKALENFTKVIEVNEEERQCGIEQHPQWAWNDEPFVILCYLYKAEILAFEGCSHEAKENLIKYTQSYKYDMKKISSVARFRRVTAKLVNMDNNAETWWEKEYKQFDSNQKEVDWDLQFACDFKNLAVLVSNFELPKSYYFNYACALFEKSKYTRMQ